jgi:citrate lyase subunit beta/citryl-CoA lyase
MLATLGAARSLLFVPGDDAHKLSRALSSEADAIVADFEDGVAPSRKDRAREVTAAFIENLGDSAVPVLVRINAVDSEACRRDLESLHERRIAGLVVPKATTASLQLLGYRGPVLALIETPRGLLDAVSIATDDRVIALSLGGVDLTATLRLQPRTDGLELLAPRSQVVLASAAALLRAPFDTPCVHLAESDRMEAECSFARSLGFGGKACIHPSQVAIVNRMFAPTPEDRAWAQRVVEAYERSIRAGLGALQLDGEMIDLPVYARAQAITAMEPRVEEHQ